MKAPKTTILALSGLMFGASALVTAADDHAGHDHAGHDHSGHSHAEEKPATEENSATTFSIPESVKKDVDLQVQVIESREIAGKGEEVTAIPISSVFEAEGKTYVFAQSEDNAEKFERWEVTTGAFDDQFVEAVTGVFPGDKLVSNGTNEIARLQNETVTEVAVEENVSQPNTKTATVEEYPAPKPVATQSRRKRESEAIESDTRETQCQFARERNFRPHCNNRDLDVRHEYRRDIPVRVIVEDYHSHGYHDHHHHRSYDNHYHGHRHGHHHGW